MNNQNNQKSNLTLSTTLLALILMVVAFGFSPVWAAKTNLDYWTESFPEDRARAFDEMVANFNATHPDIEVSVEIFHIDVLRDILKTSLEAGEGPDLVMYDSGPGFGGLLDRAGLIMPLDEAYERFGWNESLYLIAKENTQFDGVTYGVGNELDRFYLFYNKRIFEEQGLNPPQSQQELLELCKIFSKRGIIPMVAHNKDSWSSGHWFSGMASRIARRDKLAGAISGEVPWNGTDFVKAIQTFTEDMPKAGCFPLDFSALTWQDGASLFYNGDAAMWYFSNYVLQFLMDPKTMTDPVGIMFYPSVEGGPVLPMGYIGGAFWISSATKHPEEALTFLDYLVSKEAAKYWIEDMAMNPPVIVDVSGYDIHPYYVKLLQLNTEVPVTGYNINVVSPANFNRMMYDGFQDVYLGRKTPQQQADDPGGGESYNRIWCLRN